VRAVLPTIRVPTLVVQHAEDAVVPPLRAGTSPRTYPDAKYVELPAATGITALKPTWRVSFQEIAEFLTGEQAEVADDRVLATVLFTDIVDSTRLRRGDRRP